VSGTRVAEYRRFRDLVIMLVLLVVADGLITQFLTACGLGTEMNPFVRGLLAAGRFFPVKIAGGLLAGLVLLNAYLRRPRLAQFSTLCLVLFYTAILYWNIGVVFIASGKAS